LDASEKEQEQNESKLNYASRSSKSLSFHFRRRAMTVILRRSRRISSLKAGEHSRCFANAQHDTHVFFDSTKSLSR
jgi:hypothetical protein